MSARPRLSTSSASHVAQLQLGLMLLRVRAATPRLPGGIASARLLQWCQKHLPHRVKLTDAQRAMKIARRAERTYRATMPAGFVRRWPLVAMLTTPPAAMTPGERSARREFLASLFPARVAKQLRP